MTQPLDLSSALKVFCAYRKAAPAHTPLEFYLLLAIKTTPNQTLNFYADMLDIYHAQVSKIAKDNKKIIELTPGAGRQKKANLTLVGEVYLQGVLNAVPKTHP